MAVGDLTIEWFRRTRARGELADLIDVPLNESAELYDCELLDGSAVVRTFAGLTAPTVVYTAVQQQADFGSIQAQVLARVYQIGRFGRGYPQTALVPGSITLPSPPTPPGGGDAGLLDFSGDGSSAHIASVG